MPVTRSVSVSAKAAQLDGHSMNTRALPAIPPSLSHFASEIRETVKKALNLKLRLAEDLLPWQSKIGGTPYLPESVQYPKSEAGDALKLLAQVNFSEAPSLPGYPEKGILQFYIDPTDVLLGLGSSFDHLGQNLFRVMYFEDVETDTRNLKTDVPFHINGGHIIDLDSGKESPLHWPMDPNCQLSMEFELFEQYMTSDDFRVGKDIFGIEQYSECPQLFEDYEEYFRGSGHQIGVYPYFTQTDPRSNRQDFAGYELLFQLDSEMFSSAGVDICWGDGGVGNFFVRPEDLKKHDFSRVLYYWDCS